MEENERHSRSDRIGWQRDLTTGLLSKPAKAHINSHQYLLSRFQAVFYIVISDHILPVSLCKFIVHWLFNLH